ncbi:hypothetical protein [Hyalangium rubrum]|uniref:STAS/SEC14 domain-containing protein n=1 Tax=Hyalangium rubrum TaxID=3103134 RepID=A0ABU5HA07_9BACT|nr:hypothetical protein [Hyalangium sp. s54d21]MDY7230141.1 hypothetical protein [Hyalangium sp. s54d21]
MSATKEWTFGTHHARWENPDLLRVTFRGPTRVEDVDNLFAIYRALVTERPIFVIADISRSTIDKAARERFSHTIRAEWFHGIIYVGADALQRAITKAIVLALYLAGNWRVDVEFADTEEEAMGIISRIRRARGVEPREVSATRALMEEPRAQA